MGPDVTGRSAWSCVLQTSGPEASAGTAESGMQQQQQRGQPCSHRRVSHPYDLCGRVGGVLQRSVEETSDESSAAAAAGGESLARSLRAACRICLHCG